LLGGKVNEYDSSAREGDKMKYLCKAGLRISLCLIIAGMFVGDSAAQSDLWELIGPGGGGQITSISLDPYNPDNIYITINIGGARKSTDGGVFWKTINRGFDYETRGQTAHKMMDIAVHPTNSNMLLAAGLQGDIYQSIDGGELWTLSYRHPGSIGEVEFFHYSRFHFSPMDPDLVYITVGSIQRLFIGVDARRTGEFWPKIDTGRPF
jgi:hypothetical protein